MDLKRREKFTKKISAYKNGWEGPGLKEIERREDKEELERYGFGVSAKEFIQRKKARIKEEQEKDRTMAILMSKQK